MIQNTIGKLNKGPRAYKIVRGILKLFFRKPRLDIAEPIPTKCILVANHVKKSGPVTYNLYLPFRFAMWGASEMLGNYTTRRKYLSEVYYQQKKHYKKLPSKLIASFEAIFSPIFYYGMNVLPTYHTGHLKTTIKTSLEVLNKNYPVLVFPEDSTTGYHDTLTNFFGGFVVIAELYFKQYGEDIPIIPIYFNKKKRVIHIGKAEYAQALHQQGLTRQQIADLLCERVNNLNN